MNMDFQTACSALRTVTVRDEVVMLLQQITAFLLKGGVFEVYGVECRPLELESYFYRAGVFEDAYVHENERQLNHFGELYVHRIGVLATSHYKMDNRVCVGICLSDSTDYYYSALIRSARFATGEEVFGPNNVLTAWLRRINAQTHTVSPERLESLRPGGHELAPLLPLLEEKPVLHFEPSALASSESESPLLFSVRVGLGDKSPADRDLPLRGVVGPLLATRKYKDKTRLLRDYLEAHALTGQTACEAARHLIGSVPSWVKQR